MAHIQSKPAHDSGVQHTKDLQAINATKATAGGNHRSPQMEVTHADKTAERQPGEEPSHGLVIMGFPWQFVVVMGVMAFGILAVVLRAIGLF